MKKRIMVCVAICIAVFFSVTTINAEMTEAEKKAFEAEKKAAELAAEGETAEGETAEPEPVEPEPVEPVEEEQPVEIQFSEKSIVINWLIDTGNGWTIQDVGSTVYDVDPNVIITKDGVSADIIELDSCCSAMIRYDAINNVIYEIDARSFPTHLGDTNTTGFITQTGSDSIQLSNWITVTVVPDTIITINGVQAVFSDLVYGDSVQAFYYGATNVAAELIVGRAVNDPDTVYDVGTIRGTGTVTDFYKGNALHWWMLLSGGPFEYRAANASGPQMNPALRFWPLWLEPAYGMSVRVELGVVVTINGNAASMLDIQPGDEVTVLVDEVAPSYQGRALFIDVVR